MTVYMLLLVIVLLLHALPLSATPEDDTSREALAEWINDYSQLRDEGFGDLVNTDEDAQGFLNVLESEGYTTRTYGDLAAHESHFEKPTVDGSDYLFMDDVDYAYFSGHGTEEAFWFGVNSDGDRNFPYRVHYTETYWGDRDAEWIFISACQVLSDLHRGDWRRYAFFNGDDRNWHNLWFHGMTGFTTTIPDDPNLGQRLANYLTDNWGPLSIEDSWFWATVNTFSATEQAAIMYPEIVAKDAQGNIIEEYDYGHEFLAEFGDVYADPKDLIEQLMSRSDVAEVDLYFITVTWWGCG